MKQQNSIISCWYSNEQDVKPVIQSDGMCKELHPLELDASKPMTSFINCQVLRMSVYPTPMTSVQTLQFV